MALYYNISLSFLLLSGYGLFVQRTERDSVKHDLKFCECGCKEEIPIINKRGEHARFKHGHNRRDIIPINYKDGSYIDSNNYRRILKKGHYKTDSDGYVKEHIYNYETYYNCCICKWAVIHHKDENRQNNKIENLECMFRSKHTSLHRNPNHGPL